MKNFARQPLMDEVLDHLDKLVSSMDVGDKLPTENELVNQLGVSRQTVREVLIALQAQGKIEVRRGVGAFVIDQAESNRQRFANWFKDHKYQIQELLEMRLAIEPTVAELAAKRITPAELELLEKSVNGFQKVLDANIVPKIVAADEEFHEIILNASKNTALKFFYDTFIPSLREYRSRVFSPPADPYLALKHHEKIYAAIASGDSDLAFTTMRNHILESKYDVHRIASDLGVQDSVETP